MAEVKRNDEQPKEERKVLYEGPTLRVIQGNPRGVGFEIFTEDPREDAQRMNEDKDKK
jgi:hypothetical protein